MITAYQRQLMWTFVFKFSLRDKSVYSRVWSFKGPIIHRFTWKKRYDDDDHQSLSTFRIRERSNFSSRSNREMYDTANGHLSAL